MRSPLNARSLNAMLTVLEHFINLLQRGASSCRKHARSASLLHVSTQRATSSNACCMWRRRSRTCTHTRSSIALRPRKSTLTVLRRSLQLLHRDVKLQNILLDDKQRIAKLADLSLATKQSRISLTTNSGTFGYIAPEVSICLSCI